MAAALPDQGALAFVDDMQEDICSYLHDKDPTTTILRNLGGKCVYRRPREWDSERWVEEKFPQENFRVLRDAKF